MKIEQTITEEPKPWAKAAWLTPKLDAILTAMDGITAQRRMAVTEKYLVGKGTAKELEELYACGIADAAPDVNDPAEAGSLVAELHALAIKYHCPLLNIIHVNPGSESKTRGHLGSQLERKSETNLRLEKDASGVTAIWADKNRRAPISKSTAPRFAWSDPAGMHVTVQNLKSTQDDADRETLTELAAAAFSERPSMGRMDLETTVKNRLTVSAKTAERKVRRMIELGLVKKTIAGLYTTTT